MSDDSRESYSRWLRFRGDRIPSSLETHPVLYEKIKKGSPIADIGCGFGKTSFELVTRGYGPVTGFDINESGIEFARKGLQDLGEPLSSMASFEVRDAVRTGYSKGEFRYGVMQALLTTIPKADQREAIVRETRRIIRRDGGLYVAEFVQTWHNTKMRQKYELGRLETGEEGSFNACNKETGEFEYQAHHYSEKELVYLLLQAEFQIDLFKYEVFRTRSGNLVNGAVIWAI